MKLVILLCSAIALLLIGGIIYFSVVEVPIEKKQITKPIPNERFFDAD